MNANPEQTVTIAVKEYESLLKNEEWLAALEFAGVNNWEGYEEAISILEGWENE